MFDFEMPPLDWRVCRIPKPKKPGEYRKITIPNDALKAVQRDILHYLYSVKGLWPSHFAHGFVPHRSINTGAAAHDRMADVILCMDVRDFFDNFPLEPIRKRMREAGVGEHLTEKILTACSYNGTIPQGGPCSPWLTNIGMFEVDLMISSYAKRHGFHFTRYADDITLSTTFSKDGTCDHGWLFMFYGIDKLLSENLGLHLKFSKNHVIHINGKEKRRITGVVIRKDGLGYNAPVELREKARCMVHNLARKLMDQGGVPKPEDHLQWMRAKGLVTYSDGCRIWGDGEAASADGRVQVRYWKYLEDLFHGRVDRKDTGQ